MNNYKSRFFFPEPEKINTVRMQLDSNCVFQFVSGHGNFSKRKHTIGLENNPMCKLCNQEPADSFHVILRCTGLTEQRNILKHELNKLSINLSSENDLKNLLSHNTIVHFNTFLNTINYDPRPPINRFYSCSLAFQFCAHTFPSNELLFIIVHYC